MGVNNLIKNKQNSNSYKNHNNNSESNSTSRSQNNNNNNFGRNNNQRKSRRQKDSQHKIENNNNNNHHHQKGPKNGLNNSKPINTGGKAGNLYIPPMKRSGPGPKTPNFQSNHQNPPRTPGGGYQNKGNYNPRP